MTTMWKEATLADYESRESEIQACYWKGMLDSGSNVVRFDGSGSSVWAAVDVITAQTPLITLGHELRKDLEANRNIVIVYALLFT